MFSVAHGLAATDTFYPQLNDISWITDASLGVYGASYEAPAEEASPFPPHGSYDYCTMPHPRVEEYLLPTAVANGSLEASLIYLEYVQRQEDPEGTQSL